MVDQQKNVPIVLILVLCVLAAFCEGIDLQAAGLAASGIRPEFKPDASQMGSFFSASTLGLLIGALCGGWLSDQVGRKAVLVGSIALFAVFTLLTAISSSMDMLFWMRLATGLGLGGALPNLIALVSESSPERRRSANVALVYSGTPFGGAVISLVSMLNAPEHWRLLFVIGGVVPLLVAPLMAWKLPESVAFQQSHARLEHAGGGAGKAGNPLEIFAAGRAGRTLLLWVSFFLALLTLYLLLNWLPTLLQGNGLSRPQADFAQIGFNFGGALAALWIGRLMEGPRRRASVTTLFIALPLLLAALAYAPAQVALVVAIVFLLGGAIVSAQAFLYASAPGLYPTLIRGMGVGAAVAVGRTGSVVGPKLGGILKNSGYDSSHLLLALVPVAVVAGLCAIILVQRQSRD